MGFPKGRSRDILVPSAGLTTAATPYTSGDVLGGLLTIRLNAGSAQGSVSGCIRGLVITDKSAVIGATDLYLFNASVTPAADNAAFAPSDTEIVTCIGVISATTVFTHGGNKLVQWLAGEEIPFFAPSGALYGVAVTRTTNNQFGAATDLNFRLLFETD